MVGLSHPAGPSRNPAGKPPSLSQARMPSEKATVVETDGVLIEEVDSDAEDGDQRAAGVASSEPKKVEQGSQDRPAEAKIEMADAKKAASAPSAAGTKPKPKKSAFNFANALSGVGNKDQDVLGDGSVRKRKQKAGDGGHWFNDDWMLPSARTKCVVHVKVQGKPAGESAAKTVSLSFVLGGSDMHDGMTVAVKTMSVGEVADFTFTALRLAARGALAKKLPAPSSENTTWRVTFLKFATWEDLAGDASQLQKIHNEGWGRWPEDMAEVHAHWRIFGADGTMVHSSRYTVSMASAGGIQNTEDEDKPAPVYILGEDTWEPITILCRSLRQGGVGELRMRQLPQIPKTEKDGTSDHSAQLSMMLNSMQSEESRRHCTVRVELERVVPPLSGPEDPRWEGVTQLVQERFRAEQFMEGGFPDNALGRYRRIVAWGEQMEQDSLVLEQLAEARAAIGWILVCRAQPILDAGTVTAEVLKLAQADALEAGRQCEWLEAKRPGHASTLLLKAKLLVATDDDFAGAHTLLMQAQRLEPGDKRIQEELRTVKVEFRRLEEEQGKQRLAQIRDGLKRARTEPGDGGREEVLALLRELADLRVTWESVMDTRIGVELKGCKEACGEEATRLCDEILARFKDESKQQRPMWDS